MCAGAGLAARTGSATDLAEGNCAGSGAADAAAGQLPLMKSSHIRRPLPAVTVSDPIHTIRQAMSTMRTSPPGRPKWQIWTISDHPGGRPQRHQRRAGGVRGFFEAVPRPGRRGPEAAAAGGPGRRRAGGPGPGRPRPGRPEAREAGGPGRRRPGAAAGRRSGAERPEASAEAAGGRIARRITALRRVWRRVRRRGLRKAATLRIVATNEPRWRGSRCWCYGCGRCDGRGPAGRTRTGGKDADRQEGRGPAGRTRTGRKDADRQEGRGPARTGHG